MAAIIYYIYTHICIGSGGRLLNILILLIDNLYYIIMPCMHTETAEASFVLDEIVVRTQLQLHRLRTIGPVKYHRDVGIPKTNHHLKGVKGEKTLLHERHKRGIAAVPLLSGVLF